MKIKAIMPDRARDRETLDSREAMLASALSKDASLSVDNIKIGPGNSDTDTDEVFASEDMIRQCIRAERDGFDAIVVYCFSDVAIDAIRENVSVPVVGPAETSLAVAGMLFNRFAVVTTLASNKPSLYRKLVRNSVAREKMTSIRSLDIPLDKLRLDPSATERRLIEVCREAMEAEGIDGAILGCLGMATYGKKVEVSLPIRVLDPAFVAVAYAEMCARLGIRHSAIAYPRFMNANNLKLM